MKAFHQLGGAGSRLSISILAFGLSTSLMFTGCGGSDNATNSEKTTTTRPTSTSQTSTSSPPSAAAAVNQQTANPCVDVRDDSVIPDPSTDIKSVGLSRSGNELVVERNLAGPVATNADQALWSVWVSDYDASGNGPSRQLGYKIAGGSARSYVFEFSGAKQTNLTTPAVVQGSKLSVRFPESAVDGMNAKSAKWKATTSWQGDDVDTCGAGETIGLPS